MCQYLFIDVDVSIFLRKTLSHINESSSLKPSMFFYESCFVEIAILLCTESGLLRDYSIHATYTYL